MSASKVSELVRERETFKYGATLLAGIGRGQVDHLRPPPDAALAAFAELALLRISGHKASISLFDSSYQYIVAQATSTSPLDTVAATDVDNGIPQRDATSHTGVIVIDRNQSASDHVVVHSTLSPPSQSAPAQHWLGGSKGELPVSVIPDTSAHPTIKCEARDRFYVGVPLRTKQRINIGVLSVYGGDPERKLDVDSMQALQRLSSTVMGYLEMKRSHDSHRRADRMVRGVGSFVEGSGTMTGWQEGPNPGSFKDDPHVEGALHQAQQQLEEANRDYTMASNMRPTSLFGSPPSQTQSILPPGPASPMTQGSSKPAAPQSQVSQIFSRAANLLRESIEVEGLVFFDAGISSFGGKATTSTSERTNRSHNRNSSESSRDSGSSVQSLNSDPDAFPCQVLGYSNSSGASLDEPNVQEDLASMPEKYLAKLLKRNPQGKVYNFDEGESLLSSDVSADEVREALPVPATPAAAEPNPLDAAPTAPARRSKRQREGKFISSIFPGARSVVFFPIWDSQKQCWFAGGFAYTRTLTRVFSVRDELSYLMAFGTVIMSEISRAESSRVDHVKTDILNSLSHELRSPLHGVVLGAELLHDTALSAFQGDILHSIETCGRTLLDTIDQLLDWSQANKFIHAPAERGRAGKAVSQRGVRPERKKTIEAGMMSATVNIDLDALAEEVVESVCAGYTFQRASLEEATTPSEHPSMASLKRLDSMRAMESMRSGNTPSGNAQVLLGDFSVILDIDASVTWAFHAQPGAIRRVLMNILGNALKFTTRGFIQVTFSQPQSPQSRSGTQIVEIAVRDSGSGISDDYLRHHLFSAFAQESDLSTGSGLGLSIVKRIVSTLGGSVKVQSHVGEGTCVSVSLPMEPMQRAVSPAGLVPARIGDGSFAANVCELKGLRVRILGFPKHHVSFTGDRLHSHTVDEYEVMARMCCSWLQMRVIDPSGRDKLVPDLLLVSERRLDELPYEERGFNSTPVVVLCRDAVAARRLATSPKFMANKGRGVYEFSSEPIGPRKLAKILCLSFKRWISTQTDVSVSAAPFGDHPKTFDPEDEQEEMDASDESEVAPDTSPLPQSLVDPVEKSEESLRTAPELSKTSASTAQPSQPTSHDRLQRPTLARRSTSEAWVPRFLLVDDNVINVKILASYMKKLGKSYETAADGQQALDAFRRSAERHPGHLQCIFMDISMPVMDGFQASRAIRALESSKQIPRCSIFALTGLASEDAQKEAFASGIDLFLTKPVRLKELTNILRRRALC